MEMYKQANKLKLRFSTPKGMLSTEQLWDLNMTDLSSSIKTVKKQLNKNNDDELSFLNDTIDIDETEQLRFNVLKDIYLTKKKDIDDLRNARDIKEHNQKILSLIAKKKDESLENLPVEDLEKLIK
jgi:hypothetical protein